MADEQRFAVHMTEFCLCWSVCLFASINLPLSSSHRTTARSLGTITHRLGQPRVLGELLAGLILGPTVLGPSISEWLFPAKIWPIVDAVGDLGVVFFSLGVGYKFDPELLPQGWKGGAQISILSASAVLFPVALAYPLALWLDDSKTNVPVFAGENADFRGFFFILSSGLSVSALPIAALMLKHLKLLESPLGRMTIGVAAIVTVFMFVQVGSSLFYLFFFCSFSGCFVPFFPIFCCVCPGNCSFFLL
jgi:Kef-type K+ transport system membrane component KefB